jgi:RNA polymerase sigma-70 factor (ECF subfamily)
MSTGPDPESPEVRARALIERAITDYRDDLLRRARMLCGKHDEADDLVQRTVERALLRAHLFDLAREPSVLAWLHRVQTNLFIDQFRKRSRRPLHEDIDTVQVPTPEPDHPPPWAGCSTDDVWRAVEQLPPEFREAFVHFEIDKLSYGEIATRLGIKPSTVGTRILRARARLKEALMRPASPASQNGRGRRK